MLVRGKHDSRLIFTNIKADRSSVRNVQVRPQLRVPYSTKKYPRLLLCDLLLSVNINFELLTNKLEARLVDLTHLNPRNFCLYTSFTCLKLSNGKEVGVLIAFRFPNRFSFYIFTSLRPPIRMHIKFIIINKLEFAPYR